MHLREVDAFPRLEQSGEVERELSWGEVAGEVGSISEVETGPASSFERFGLLEARGIVCEWSGREGQAGEPEFRGEVRGMRMSPLSEGEEAFRSSSRGRADGTGPASGHFRH